MNLGLWQLLKIVVVVWCCVLVCFVYVVLFWQLFWMSLTMSCNCIQNVFRIYKRQEMPLLKYPLTYKICRIKSSHTEKEGPLRIRSLHFDFLMAISNMQQTWLVRELRPNDFALERKRRSTLVFYFIFWVSNTWPFWNIRRRRRRAIAPSKVSRNCRVC